MPEPRNAKRWSTTSLLVVGAGFALLGSVVGRLTPSTPATVISAATKSPSKSRPASPLPESLREDVVASAPWEDRWREWSTQSSTPARDAALAALIEELAQSDPDRALALAKANSNWRLRDLLRDAAMGGWASVAPDAAAQWVLGVRLEDRRAVVAALLTGAAKHPAKAVRVALHLCAADPEPAGDYGHAAVDALVQAGEFEAAVNFGLEVGTTKYPFLLKSAFYQWAQREPEKAMAALTTIEDPLLRSQAREQAFMGWVRADAKAVADYAITLPPGEARTQALASALPHWVEKDPSAAGEWIKRNDSGADFDAGVVAVANLQSLVTQQPRMAMELAGNITDGAARSQTMRAVFRQWANRDIAAARSFIEGVQNTNDRAALVDELKDLLPDG